MVRTLVWLLLVLRLVSSTEPVDPAQSAQPEDTPASLSESDAFEEARRVSEEWRRRRGAVATSEESVTVELSGAKTLDEDFIRAREEHLKTVQEEERRRAAEQAAQLKARRLETLRQEDERRRAAEEEARARAHEAAIAKKAAEQEQLRAEAARLLEESGSLTGDTERVAYPAHVDDKKINTDEVARLEAERLVAERKAVEEARLEAERAAAERKAVEEARQEAERAAAERKAVEEARQEAERLAAERKAVEEARLAASKVPGSPDALIQADRVARDTTVGSKASEDVHSTRARDFQRMSVGQASFNRSGTLGNSRMNRGDELRARASLRSAADGMSAEVDSDTEAAASVQRTVSDAATARGKKESSLEAERLRLQSMFTFIYNALTDSF